MHFLEKDLENIIFEASKTQKGQIQLQERGLDFIQQPLERQIDLGVYGVLDLIQIHFEEAGNSPKIEIDLIELKKDEINMDTFLQAVKYCKGVVIYLRRKYEHPTVNFTIHLIGKTIDIKTNFCFLPDFLCNYEFCLHLYEYKADLERGFYFENKSGYYSTERKDGKMELFLELVGGYEKQYMVDFVNELYTSFKSYNLDDERAKYCVKIFLAAIPCRDITAIGLFNSSIKEIAETILVTTDEKLNDVKSEIIARLSENEIHF